MKETKSQLEEGACFWLSFADTGGFKGVVVTKALNFDYAIKKTYDLEINPGGEVKAFEVDPSAFKDGDFDRLLSKDYLIESDLGVSSLG